MLCQRCNKNPGKPYKIYYGKQLRERTKYDVVPTTSLFKIDKNQSVFLCKKCVHGEPKQWILFIVLVILGLILGFLTVYSIISPWSNILSIPFGLAAFGVCGYSLMMFFKVTEDRGIEKAKEMLKEKYINDGYNVFWDEEEYKKFLKINEEYFREISK